MADQLKTDLQQVRDLLAVPQRWTQGAHACTVSGGYVPPLHPSAVCFCLDGAVAKVAGALIGDRYLTIAQHPSKAPRAYGDNVDYVDFNDDPETTHADVLAFLDERIAAL